MKQLEELIRKEVELRHALERKGAQWMINPDKPGIQYDLFHARDELRTAQYERLYDEWLRTVEQIDRLKGAPE